MDQIMNQEVFNKYLINAVESRNQAYRMQGRQEHFSVLDEAGIVGDPSCRMLLWNPAEQAEDYLPAYKVGDLYNLYREQSEDGKRKFFQEMLEVLSGNAALDMLQEILSRRQESLGDTEYLLAHVYPAVVLTVGNGDFLKKLPNRRAEDTDLSIFYYVDMEFMAPTFHDLQPPSRNEGSITGREERLTADDITDLKEIHREYHDVTRTITHIFTCNIQGEPDILTYELFLHENNEEGFKIHTEKNDIWANWDQRMGWKELMKLKEKVKNAAAFGRYVRDIRSVHSLSSLDSIQCSFWDDRDPGLTPEQRQKISYMIEQKRKDLRNAPFFAENEELLFDTKDPTDRYAIYQLCMDSMGRDRSYFYMGMEFVKLHGMEVKGMDYDMVYGGVLETERDFELREDFDPTKKLDQIYEKFNLNRPQGFTGHSLSVSDVVMLKRGGETKAYYVDSVGYAELPDFVQERQTIAANVCRNHVDARRVKEHLPDQEEQSRNLRPKRMKR